MKKTISYIIEKDNPQVIFLLPPSIPQVIETDLDAICKELQLLYPQTILLSIGYGSFNVKQHQGIEKALLLLVESLTIEIEKSVHPTYNILGSCADLFNFEADVREVVRLLEGGFGIKPNCILTSEASVNTIKEMGKAHLNLVIRREGEPAAKFLKETFNTPYLFSRPYGIKGTKNWLHEIAQLTDLKLNENFIRNQEYRAFKLLKPAMPSFNHIARATP